jgi:hypothetical protein
MVTFKNMIKAAMATGCLIAIAVLLGCAPATDNHRNTPPPEPSSNDVDIPTAPLDADYTPRNFSVTESNDVLYYTAADGMYKMQQGAGAEKIIDGEWIRAVAVVEPYVFYIQYQTLYRADLDGGNIAEPEANISLAGNGLSAIWSFQNELILDATILAGQQGDEGRTVTGFQCSSANVDQNGNLEFQGIKGKPSPNGMIYEFVYLDEVSAELYAHSPDGTQRYRVIDRMDWGRYIVTSRYIFYLRIDPVAGGNTLWRCDLNGENAKEFVHESLVDSSGIQVFELYGFESYDDEWIYFWDSGEDVYMLNQTDGTAKTMQRPSTNFSEVLNGYLYGYVDSGQRARVNIDTGETEILPSQPNNAIVE